METTRLRVGPALEGAGAWGDFAILSATLGCFCSRSSIKVYSASLLLCFAIQRVTASLARC